MTGSVGGQDATATNGPYTMVIQRDLESGWLVGHLIELPGCHTQASDIASLQVNIREVVELYLETVGDVEPESPFIGTLRIDVPV